MISPLTTVTAADRGGTVATKVRGKTRPHAGFWALTVGSIGVVYGDIGTSPLYAMRESVVAAVGARDPADETAGFGLLSLIIWAVLLVVTLQYVVVLLAGGQQRRRRHARVDGAGTALVDQRRGRRRVVRHHQRRAVLRRRHDHARAVGALRNRGPQGRHSGFRSLRGPTDRAHSGGALHV